MSVDIPQGRDLHIARVHRRWGMVNIPKVGRVHSRWTKDLPVGKRGCAARGSPRTGVPVQARPSAGPGSRPVVQPILSTGPTSR